MEITGTVRGGVIVVDSNAGLSEGQTVVVKISPTVQDPDPIPGFGIWADRDDLGDTAEASLKLRRSMERGLNEGVAQQ